MQQKTELDLAYRYQVGVGGSYNMNPTDSNQICDFSGVLSNVEKTLETQDESTNFEGLLSFQYKWFRYRSPKIDLTTSINSYRSFTVWSRIWLEYNLQAKFEIVKDLYFSITL